MARWHKQISIIFSLYSAALGVAYSVFLLIDRSYVEPYAVKFAAYLPPVITFSFLAALLFYHRPENVISRILVIVAFLHHTVFAQVIIDILIVKGAQPTLGLLFWRNLWTHVAALTYTTFAYVFILFPNGRLPSPRWRPVIWLLLGQALLAVGPLLYLTYDAAQAFSSASAAGVEIALDFSNVMFIHVRPIPQLALTLILYSQGAIILFVVLLGLRSQVGRFRGGSRLERQQIKWVVFVIAVWVFLILLVMLPNGIPFSAIVVASSLLPMAIVVPIMRYRLYDIDLIIRRTLVFSVLTGLLAAIYFISVAILQWAFTAVSGQDSPVIIVLSTLAIAALFAPLRRRVQSFIDRRFYRRKYDAEQILAQFAATVQHEVDMQRLTAELMSLVEQTLQPESVSLWLKES